MTIHFFVPCPMPLSMKSAGKLWRNVCAYVQVVKKCMGNNIMVMTGSEYYLSMFPVQFVLNFSRWVVKCVYVCMTKYERCLSLIVPCPILSHLQLVRWEEIDYGVCLCLVMTGNEHYLSLFPAKFVSNFSKWVIKMHVTLIYVCMTNYEHCFLLFPAQSILIFSW